MATYANGKLPASVLTKLSVPGYLRSDAAASFERLRAAAKKDGFNMGTSNASQAYRTFAEQVSVLKQHYDNTWRPGLTRANGGIKYYDGKTWYRLPGHPTASDPGVSNHGWGLAMDFQGLGGKTGAGFKWMARHAGEYGWDNVQGASIGEPWHWVYNPANDKHKNDKPTQPTTPAKEDDDMKYKGTTTSQRQAISPDEWRGVKIGDGATYSILTQPHDTFHSDVYLAIEGLAVGAVVQARFAVYDRKQKKYTTNFPIKEIIGTAGTSFDTFGISHSFTGENQDLRVRITGPKGAVITKASTYTLYSS